MGAVGVLPRDLTAYRCGRTVVGVTLGEKIRKAREEAGLSAYALAPLIEATPAAVRLWEQDLRHPRFDFVVRIAEATGKTLEYFAEEVQGDADADQIVHGRDRSSGR